MPVTLASPGFQAVYTAEEFSRIRCGLIPGGMDDRWFVFYEDGWLHAHRSWTGLWCYSLRFQDIDTGMAVVESWVMRDPEAYDAALREHDCRMLRFVIDGLMLRKPEMLYGRP